MSDEQDDPLSGLLTDIAEGVAALAARVDAMEASTTAHQTQMNEALATIAEIATRTYYASKPPSDLPEDVINAKVIDPMIERWPLEWRMRFPSSEFKTLNDLESLSAGEIEAQLRQRATIAEDATNAQRLRRARALVMLNEEMDRRTKVRDQCNERDGRTRG